MPTHSWKERLRYRIDRFFQSGFALQLVIASLVVIAVIILFTVGAEMFRLSPGSDFEGDGGQFWPSSRFWWVITHTLESYWIEESFPAQITATVLTLFNLLVFAAVVGLVGSKIQERLENMRRGTSRAIEDNHYVIVGWSEKVLPVIRELRSGWERGPLVIAVLTERPIEEVQRELRRGLRGMKPVRLVVREGRSADMDDLQLVSVSTARGVIVMRRPLPGGDSDARVVKTLMAVAHLIRQADGGGADPFVIAEIERQETVPLAKAAAHGLRVSLVQPVDALGKIILQTARQPGLAGVYREILDHQGNELHSAPASRYPGLVGKPWREVVFAFPAAVPIGIFRNGAVRLVPHASVPALTLLADDTLYFIAPNSKSLYAVSDSAPSFDVPILRLSEHGESAETIISNILVIGFNEKALPLIREYNAYAGSAGKRFSLTLVTPFGLAHGLLENVVFQSLDIRIVNEDYLVPGMLERIDAAAFDAVIVLSETSEGGTWEDADTRVIMTLLLLRTLRWKAEDEARPIAVFHHVVGEILHVYNKDLAESTNTIRDVIITPELVSRMIAQMCRDPRVEGALKDLFDEQGAEIYLKPISRYAAPGSRVTFNDLLAASVQRGETAIGIALPQPGGGEMKVILNPRKEDTYALTPKVRLIVISEGEM